MMDVTGIVYVSALDFWQDLVKMFQTLDTNGDGEPCPVIATDLKPST